ncbi:MAG TPA: S41 family peptidase [Anaerolineaceae bacterium]
MKNKFLPLLSLIVILTLFQAGCQINVPVPEVATPIPAPLATSTQASPTPTAAKPTLAIPTLAVATAPAPTPIIVPAGGEQPVRITGGFTYTNGIAVETYYVEQAVALADMHGFVVRDQEWKTPIDGQALGYLSIDKVKKQGVYHLDLPAQPEGTYNDVSHRNQNDAGVQIFAVSYWPNLAGGPFAEGDDPSLGWPNYLASVETDSGNKNEVIGGKLIVYAPDDKQLFPTGYGADGLLFTADDPEGPLPAGYSVIDLDQKPFGISRKSSQDVTLYEPKDYAVKDFSNLSYSAAFKQAFDLISTHYAFNGIAGKQPDWNKLYADLAPRIAQAEANKDANAYYKALLDFTLAFKDGHVSLSGGQAESTFMIASLYYGYGFAIRELDSGQTIAVFVLQNGPADNAGMKVGAEITAFNNTPIHDAISAANTLQPSSTDYGKRYDQAQMLTRGANGSQASVTFKNPGEAAQTVTLRAVRETQSFRATYLFSNQDPTALPVEYKILPSGAGYVKINSNDDDLNLIVRLFQRALQTFKDNNVPGIIIDMRLNPGGSPLGLAGFLTNHDILLGQLEYYSGTTGKFEPDGPPERFTPNVEQYTFKKMALLVDQSCYSACELEAFGFSQVPGMMVIGMYPTGGTEAEVSRGQFNLPEGISLQIPFGRFVLPDGSLFLEGSGVQPTLKVPITAQNVLSTDDVVLNTADQQINK